MPPRDNIYRLDTHRPLRIVRTPPPERREIVDLDAWLNRGLTIDELEADLRLPRIQIEPEVSKSEARYIVAGLFAAAAVGAMLAIGGAF